MSELNNEQMEILKHTEKSPNSLFCGGSPDMDKLVELGLMTYAGRTGFCPDPYYQITGEGRAALRPTRNAAGNLLL
jgi:hypothetical protein